MSKLKEFMKRRKDVRAERLAKKKAEAKKKIESYLDTVDRLASDEVVSDEILDRLQVESGLPEDEFEIKLWRDVAKEQQRRDRALRIADKPRIEAEMRAIESKQTALREKLGKIVREMEDELRQLGEQFGNLAAQHSGLLLIESEFAGTRAIRNPFDRERQRELIVQGLRLTKEEGKYQEMLKSSGGVRGYSSAPSV